MKPTGALLTTWYTQPMNKAQEKKQAVASITKSRWFYIVGGLVLLCFLLGFTPGGRAMWTLGYWILSWAVTIWFISRFGVKGFLKFVLIGLIAFLLMGVFLI